MASAGERAEAEVATYLQERRYKILDRNWRNKYSEIDIVARQGQRIYIVEVKYRRNLEYGDGFDYITTEKKRRLRRAAAAWALDNDWTGDMQIDVAAVTGAEFKIDYRANVIEPE
ncbi:MAG: YraN family protein [Candidatus Saccharimonadales bacterium]